MDNKKVFRLRNRWKVDLITYNIVCIRYTMKLDCQLSSTVIANIKSFVILIKSLFCTSLLYVGLTNMLKRYNKQHEITNTAHGNYLENIALTIAQSMLNRLET